MKKTAFTLIELLVTIVLFSLLLATSLYSFRFVSINIRNINNSNPQDAINYALLRNSIGSIYAYVQRKDSVIDKNFYYYFQGENNKCRFTTLSPLFFSGIAMGELSVVDNKLLYKEGEIFDKDVDYSKLDTIRLPKEIVVVDNISDIKIVYYLDSKKYLHIEHKIPNLIKIKFVKYGEDKEYLFSIKSDNKEQLIMVQEQYKEF